MKGRRGNTSSSTRPSWPGRPIPFCSSGTPVPTPALGTENAACAPEGPIAASSTSIRKQKAGIIDTTDRRCDTLVPGPLCAMYAHQLGYNVGSALMVAVHLYVDARPFISIGLAAQKLGYCRDSAVVMGIAINARAKCEPSDPAPDYHLVNLDRAIDAIRSNVNQLGVRPATGKEYRAGDPAKKR